MGRVDCADGADAEAVNAEGVLDHISEVGAAGKASRPLPKVPFKLVTGDEDVALLAISDHQDDATPLPDPHQAGWRAGRKPRATTVTGR